MIMRQDNGSHCLSTLKSRSFFLCILPTVNSFCLLTRYVNLMKLCRNLSFVEEERVKDLLLSCSCTRKIQITIFAILEVN